MGNSRNASVAFSVGLEMLLYAVIALLSFRVFAHQATITSDIALHSSIIDGYINGSYYIPHPGLHILTYLVAKVFAAPYSSVVPTLMSVLVIVTMWTTKKTLMRFLPDIQWKPAFLLAAVSLNFMTAIYVPWFNRDIYLGQWGPTIWHSPTMFLLKPFALLSFAGILVYMHQRGRRQFFWGLLVSALLLASTLAKPAYVICLIPALGVYLMTLRFDRVKQGLNGFLILLPSLLLLGYQYIRTFNMQNTASVFHDRIILTSFGVMKLHTPSVAFSTLLALAFPLSVLLVLNRGVFRNHALRLSWLLVAVAFLQAAFLAEKIKFSQGGFIWGYVISLFVLHVFTMIEYLSWYGPGKRHSIHPVTKCWVGMVGMAHLCSGVIYFVNLVRGVSWL
jgi:hypothetical protein